MLPILLSTDSAKNDSIIHGTKEKKIFNGGDIFRDLGRMQ